MTTEGAFSCGKSLPRRGGLVSAFPEPAKYLGSGTDFPRHVHEQYQRHHPYPGRIDISVLQTALNTVLAADDSLRARITLRGKTPLQYHAPFSALNCPVLDFSLTNQEGIEHWETAVTREAVPCWIPLFVIFICSGTGRTAAECRNGPPALAGWR